MEFWLSSKVCLFITVSHCIRLLFPFASHLARLLLTELNLLLQVLDPELWQHYQNTGVDMRLFAFRWILLLLSQGRAFLFLCFSTQPYSDFHIIVIFWIRV